MSQIPRLYAGIGPRKTPPIILPIMTRIAEQLSRSDWTLRSGHGKGADQAFEVGAPKHLKEVYVPYIGFNDSAAHEPHYYEPLYTPELIEIASAHHPAWDRLVNEHKAMMCRNVNILLGTDVNDPAPVSCVIYWQPQGNNIYSKGGTNHTLRVAATYGIPCFNIEIELQQIALIQFTEQVENQ